ncbi:polysaccharide biosynthesis/export family protein [Sphingobacterium sp. SYP-B4668]|uniref:polysaccharide biosynthesis/export family protein n=1 Tax=Sphingobacterium sp. SYP-B4668 TaxID=2996035 RepID=UPI0022DDC9C4|nr:polysaccharide biosynthesis/export family protein [Sphingobacterium sp. SYP-B4668]
MKTKISIILCCAGLMLLNACVVAKKTVYVKDMSTESLQPIKENPELNIQKGDRLNILVTAKDPELSVPFNAGSYVIGADGKMLTNDDKMSGQNYLVDQQGNIQFPILGALNVEKLTLDQIQNLIKNRLIADKLISDPIVKANILNFKIIVSGAVRQEVVLEVPDGKISILEAIAKAGGLGVNAAADRVTVIREENGMRSRIINNIESQTLFDSPVYHLKQNDVVYVEPKTAENTPREERKWRYIGTVLGSLTLILSVINLTK